MDTVVTVYSKPGCVQCEATERWLTKNHVPHQIIDLSTDAEALDFVQALGYSAAPVVVAGRDHWFGFSPDRLAAVTAA